VLGLFAQLKKLLDVEGLSWIRFRDQICMFCQYLMHFNQFVEILSKQYRGVV
jgi:hypothetical protein